MQLLRRKYIFLIFMLCLTCALFVLASEHSYSTVFGASSKDACHGNECLLNDAGSSSTNVNAMKNVLPVHVVITFTNAEYKRELQTKFALTVSSLLRHSTRPVTLYVIGDAGSQLLAKNILAEHVTESQKYTVRIAVLLIFDNRFIIINYRCIEWVNDRCCLSMWLITSPHLSC